MADSPDLTVDPAQVPGEPYDLRVTARPYRAYYLQLLADWQGAVAAAGVLGEPNPDQSPDIDTARTIAMSLYKRATATEISEAEVYAQEIGEAT
jgi:hypothetical protein